MAGAALASCSPRSAASRLGIAPDRPSVVLLTLDTTRADRLGCYGGPVKTPSLDDLARRGARFSRVTSAVPLTLPSHTSILTGTYPPRHGSRDNGIPAPAGGPPSVAERLRDAGYATGAFVSAFVLDHRFGLDRGFGHYDDGPFHSSAKVASMGTLERKCDQTVERALAWAAAAKKPVFLWVHLFDPHVPYDAPEPFRSTYPPYDAEVAAMDAGIGTLLAGLRAGGLPDGTVVAAVGDHGEGLGEHGEAAHGVFLYQTTLAVPLVLASLGAAGEGRVVAARVRTVDLAPTLLDLAGLEVPADLDGRSLLPLVAGTDAKDREAYAESHFGKLHFGWAEIHALVAADRKYIDAPRPELYDLDGDPGETFNVAPGENDRAERMSQDLAALRAGIPAAPATAPTADRETVEKLAALGYVGGAGGVAHPTGADPKDKTGIAEILVDARERLAEQRFPEAIAALDRLIEREPELLDATYLRGWARLELGDAAAAARDLGRVLELNPRYPMAALHLGMSLERLGDPTGALAAFDAAIALDPRHAEAWWRRGDLHAAAGAAPAALTDYRRAVEYAPDVALLRAKLGGLLLRLQDFAAAEAELRAAAALNPRLAVARFNLALLAERAGRTEEAIAEYRAAIDADPADLKPLVNLARILAARGEPGEAALLLRRALRIDPGFAPGYGLLARALEAAGDRAGASRARAHRLD
jgi:arylsulfatase A-like enzyme/Tfp pilus assembly protein PilF